MKNMLGNNEVLRRMWSGPLLTFLERLNGENGELWETEFNEFLRKGETWTGSNASAFGPLQTIPTVSRAKASVLVGTDFVADSKKLAKKDGKQTLGQEAYDFYKKKENWHLLPDDPEVQVVVFCDAQFESGSSQCVRYLYRDGARWLESYDWLGDEFSDGCVAAVSQGPQDSVT